MFLASSPGFRREILTWAPDVPCTPTEIQLLTESPEFPLLTEDPSTLSSQLQSWVRSERSQYNEPLPEAPQPVHTPATTEPPAQPEPESHNWQEGSRMGEASNPGPPQADQTSQQSAPQHLMDAALQLLQALQLLTSPSNHSPVLLPTQVTPPTAARSTTPRRRRQKRQNPGLLSKVRSLPHSVLPTRLDSKSPPLQYL